MNNEDEALLKKMAKAIVSRRLTAIAVFLLESSKPLSFVGSQFLVFIQPFVQSLLNVKEYERITTLMEDRNNVEIFIQYIEQSEGDRKNKVNH